MNECPICGEELDLSDFAFHRSERLRLAIAKHVIHSHLYPITRIVTDVDDPSGSGHRSVMGWFCWCGERFWNHADKEIWSIAKHFDDHDGVAYHFMQHAVDVP